MDIEKIRTICKWKDEIAEVYVIEEERGEHVYVYNKGELVYERVGDEVLVNHLDYYARWVVKNKFPEILERRRRD